MFDGNFHYEKRKGYQPMEYSNGRYNGHDGVVVYIREGPKYSVRIEEIHETRAIEIRLSLGDESFLVTVVYRSPGTSKALFVTCLRTYLHKTKNEKFHTIIGDMNIDLFKVNSKKLQV